MMLNGKVEVRYGPSIYRAQDALLLTTFPELEPPFRLKTDLGPHTR